MGDAAPGVVTRHAPDGAPAGRAELPTSNPTSVAFGGPAGDDLVITTSWFDLPPDERAERPLAGAVATRRPGVGGSAPPRAAR